MATSQLQTNNTPTSTPTNALRNDVGSGEDGVHDNPLGTPSGTAMMLATPNQSREHHNTAAYPTPTIQMKPLIRFDAQDCNSH